MNAPTVTRPALQADIKDLFEMVYKWGYYGVVVTEDAPAFKKQLAKVVEAMK